MTLAVIDRLVHHDMMQEKNVESYRRKTALDRKRGRDRPPAHTTLKEIENAAD